IHFSACPCHNYSLPLPLDKQWDKVWRLMIFPDWVATPNLSQLLENAPVNPWEALAPYIPSLESRTFCNLGTACELLKTLLLTSFCCERPPLSENWYRYYGERSRYFAGGPLLDHEERMWAWGAYAQSDEAHKNLWGAFHHLLPPTLTQQLHLD